MGLTQDALGKRLGVANTSISRLENDAPNYRPGVTSIAHLNKFVGMYGLPDEQGHYLRLSIRWSR